MSANLSFWATNGTLKLKKTRLVVKFFDLLSPEWSHAETRDYVLLPNQSTELLEIECPGPFRKGIAPGDPLAIQSANVVASACLLDPETGEILARHADWPEPYRFLQAPVPELTVVQTAGQDNDSTILTVSVSRPTKCVF